MATDLPESREELCRLAATQRRAGRVPEALETLKRLESLYPPFGSLFEELGFCLLTMGAPAKAIAPFEPFDIFFRELRILGSFINPFTHKRAADLIASGAIELDSLISRQATLADIPGIIKKPPAPGEIKAMFVA